MYVGERKKPSKTKYHPSSSLSAFSVTSLKTLDTERGLFANMTLNKVRKKKDSCSEWCAMPGNQQATTSFVFASAKYLEHAETIMGVHVPVYTYPQRNLAC